MELEHFSHNHRLIYNQEQNNDEEKIACCGCKELISGPSYICVKCKFFLHKRCAELSQEIKHPLHRKHPLTLFMVPPYPSGNCLCDLCGKSLDNLVYNCSLCQFDLDINCAYKQCVIGNYDHKFMHLMKSINFICDACGIEGTQSPHVCIMCQLMVHKDCISLPKAIRIKEHKHVITHFYFLQKNQSTQQCGICHGGVDIHHGGYYCSRCDYIVHVNCSKNNLIGVEDDNGNINIDALSDSSLESISDSDEEEVATENKKFSHEHDLTIIEEVNNKRLCDGCMLPISAPIYSCLKCNMFLHKKCSELTTKIKHPIHKHSLTLLAKAPSIDGLFKCNACDQYCHGFSYHCEKCDFYVDLRCCALQKTIKHQGHPHPLNLVLSESYGCYCSGCYNGKFIYFDCANCDFSLDYRCATLPISVRHRFDEKHPLKLKCNFESDEFFDHYCEICEMRIDPGSYVYHYAPWFYWCEDCDISIHPQCVLGRYPYLKFENTYSFSIHQHPLRLVQKPFTLVKKRKQYPPCDHCAQPFYDDLALQCTQCNFMIHRNGPCFSQHVQQ